MILNFTVANWKSFADDATMQLVASRERQHRETLSAVDGFRSLKVCPVASVYGGNASGKTSFFEALDFFKQFVVNGAPVGQTIQVEPYRLENARFMGATSFDITFLAEKTVYRLEVSLRQDRVLSEELTILRDSGWAKTIYSRRDPDGVDFDHSYFSAPDRVRFVADGTLENRLFLTNAVMQNVRELEEPYNWFKDSLKTIGVASRFDNLSMFYTDPGFLEFASKRMKELDTGIEEIVGEQVDVASLPVPPIALQQIQAMAPMGDQETSAVFTLEMPGDYAAEMYFVTFRNGDVGAQRLRTRHRGANGGLVTFSLQMESSGTRRLLNLMPMLFELFGGNKRSSSVYVVDELDRCFHSMLTSRIVELFLETAGRESRRQLLFTTHDLLLMNQDLLRRDEMYIAQREVFGSSELIRMNEFEGLRFDKDLLRSYLDGRFGGVPMFSASCLGGEE